ncbi:MAG: DUF2231 domain-containing protein [Vitreoscilla sp.]
MKPAVETRRSLFAAAVFGVLDPLPYGFFVAALIFDAIYSRSGEILWDKAAAWLITLGLLFAVVPRLINLVQVWVTGPRPRPFAVTLSFWLNVVAIFAAIANAFVHSRDAYGSMPDGLWLSVLTVVLLVIANLVRTTRVIATREHA